MDVTLRGPVAVAALVLALALRAVAAMAAEPIGVWCDVDTATGTGDVDDGLMLIQAFHSPEIAVPGVSCVFGNAPLERALPIARDIVGRFGPAGLAVHAGAASAAELGRDNDAVRALAAELRRRPLTILAVGPVTNMGTLVKLHPDLHGRIERIVMVAGRRPGQRFVSSERQKTPHRDFNFELDPAAMQTLLDTNIPLVFAPWEVSSHVWLSRDDLAGLRSAGGASGAWIAQSSQYWIERWEKDQIAGGFNPFDTLAIGWVTHPELIESFRGKAHIRVAPDDRQAPSEAGGVRTKPYLFVEENATEGRDVVYCFRPRPQFKPLLLARLAMPK